MRSEGPLHDHSTHGRREHDGADCFLGLWRTAALGDCEERATPPETSVAAPKASVTYPKFLLLVRALSMVALVLG